MKKFYVNDGKEAVINVRKEEVIVNYDDNEIVIYPDEYTKLVIPFAEYDYSVKPTEMSNQPVWKIVNAFRRPVKADIMSVEKREEKTVFYLSRKKYLKEKLENIQTGEIYIARIISIVQWGVFCKIDDDIMVLVHCTEVSKAFMSDISKCFEIGALIRIVITNKEIYEDYYRLLGSRKQAYYPQKFERWNKVKCLITSKLECNDYVGDTSYVCEVTPCQKGIFHIKNGVAEVGTFEYGVITKIEKEGLRIRRYSDIIQK